MMQVHKYFLLLNKYLFARIGQLVQRSMNTKKKKKKERPVNPPICGPCGHIHVSYSTSESANVPPSPWFLFPGNQKHQRI